MGRFQVVLDPAGYKYASEPGFYWYTTGAGLAEKFAQADATQAGLTQSNFYNPPGSDWLMPRPRQFSPEWYKDARIADHVVTEWFYASGITAKTFQTTKKPGEAGYPDNEWQSFVVPAGVSGMDVTSYSAIGAACGVSLPEGMATVAFANTLPVGENTAQRNSFTPHFQWFSYPEPDDILVFGWGQYALLLFHEECFLLRSPDNDKQFWEKLGSWKYGSAEQEVYTQAGPWSQQTALGLFHNPRANVRAFTLLTIGFKELALYLGGSKPNYVTVSSEPVEKFFETGGWWIGAAPKQVVSFQCQVVGYEEASTVLSVNQADSALELFNLGESYKPTIDPKFWFNGLIWTADGGSDAEVNAPTPGELIWSNEDTGQLVTIDLLGSDGLGWISDGTRFKGGLQITITPSTSAVAAGAYLTPQLRIVELKFPVKLEDRVNSSLSLSDAYFKEIRAETALYDILGKRVEIDLTPDGAALIIAGGYDLRDGYPVHVMEDADNNGSYETLRVAGWVHEPNLQLIVDTGDGVHTHRLTARGMLSRLEKLPMYLPQLTDPEDGDGFIEHTYAVRESLLQVGIDVDDTDCYVAQTDPEAGTDIARLPGTWKDLPGQAGTRVDSPWAPRWGETFVQYCERIAREWRGWVLYEELDGKIRYHTDLLVAILLGEQYSVATTIYRSHAEAAAASRVDHCWLIDPQRLMKTPEANVVRVTGKDVENRLAPTLLRRAPETIDDVTDENFLGEWRPKDLPTVLAVSERAMSQIAYITLLIAKRRGNAWIFPVPKAPWDMTPGVLEVARNLILNGRGAHLITQLEWNLVKSASSSTQFTTYTAERLPIAAIAGSSSGDYPGHGRT